MGAPRKVVAGLVVAVLGIFTLSALLLRQADDRNGIFSSIEIGGPFRLSSSRGGVVDSKDLVGKPYALFFGFTHCPEVCPTTLYEMSSALAPLGDAARDFRIFFVTVDPERDTAAVLKDYLANFDPRVEGLVPDSADLPRLASDFRVYYARQPTSDGSYTMDHTASVFLFDAAGRFAGTIAYGEDPAMRSAKLRRLLGEP